jgi:hypothetical protein
MDAFEAEVARPKNSCAKMSRYLPGCVPVTATILLVSSSLGILRDVLPNILVTALSNGDWGLLRGF